MNNLRSKILEFVGEASMCWESVDKAGVFDTTKALDVADRMYREMVEEFRKSLAQLKEREE